MKQVKKKTIPWMLAAGMVLSSAPMIPEAAPAAMLEENFEASASLPAGWKVVQGQAAVQNGKLTLTSPSTSQPARVLVPLAEEAGDYVIEADMTFLSAVEDSRWASVMYRVQEDNYPYYQFAVRRNAAAMNGLEFAMRNQNNQWEVLDKTFYSEPFAFQQTYRLKIVAKGSRVQQYVNGQLVIDTDMASAYQKGSIGFQAAGTTVQFDNVRVTSQEAELPPLAQSGAFLPKEAETNILNAPTILSSAATPQAVDSLAGTGISSMVMKTNSRLMVNGTPLKTMLDKMKGKMIPVIQLEEKAAVQPLASLLKEMAIQDVHLASSDPALIDQVKQEIPSARGAVIYDRQSLNKHDISRFIREIHKHNAKVAILPQKLLSADLVHTFHSRTVSVWGVAGPQEADAHQLIHAGVDGIIAQETAPVVKAFSQYPKNTLVQRPIVAAHRGIPSLAPENTMAGYQKAYELGADLIETDLQRTKDGQLVIMHDASVDRTTNGTGKVSEMTFEEIRQLDAGIKFGPEFAGEKVPSFREYLQAFKGTDAVLLVELKAAGIEEQTIKEIEEEGMTDQVLIQSFDFDSVKKSDALKPEIGTGFLYSSSPAGSADARLKNARQMLNSAARMNATLNSSYGSLSQEFITYMRQRGMINLHWTFRKEEALKEQMLKGMIGPITDYTQWLNAAPVRLETPIKKRNLKVGAKAQIQAKAFVNYRTQKKETIETSLYAPDNQQVVAIEGNTIEAIAPGTAQVFVQHTFHMLGQEWRLVSEPIEITVK
ncbi:glycerophosphodiester phosphodiesterase family protein [Bacillus xiapuensis]|uniref:glycerophosphodiester phosphodiesterase family protein n=1 Tax=Bacillus xiapuensis TaxID=2014075 RepID=UPI000C234DF6|nr:glycerophosphodiester phosphodiesterase family protein [Bacillus xiapuensis]